ncbi:MAG: cache domain-containing protein [Ideonella sp.]|nr:cache domain-containing protein [Ideonella sp.]
MTSAVPTPSAAARDPAPFNDGFFAHHGIWAPGVRLFRLLGFRTKSSIVTVLLLLPMLALVLWQVWAGNQRELDVRGQGVQQQVQAAHGVLAWAQAQEAAGKLTREQAQSLAAKTVAAMRFGDGNYLWINDMGPRMVMHPVKPELNGTDVSGNKDPNGLALFMAFVDTVKRQKAGFVAYQWSRPGTDKPVDKVSYVMGFEPWGWIVGAGIYVDDTRNASLHDASAAAVVLLLAIVLGGYANHCFYLVMRGGLRETERHLKAMTEGDLTTSPSPWGRDEAANLMNSVRAMQESLRDMVQQVREASTDIGHTSSEIASGAQDLHGRTEQTAANLEQSASAMEQISATVTNTADQVQEAATLAKSNAQVAQRGGQVMSQMVSTMQDIHSASARIGDIIGTIDGIAFQTNILALNAAVEAARAGEAGRGFAVVAQEVRALAGRSADSAREIKALIGASVEKVATGANIVREAGDTIQEIVGSAMRVNQLMGEIATGAKEQAAGVNQIGAAVTELDRMTQQNAAMVEQTAAAANAMQDQARTLQLDVARFRLPQGHAVHRVAAVVALADFDFDKAIDAHRQWKVTLRRAIADRERLDADTLCKDDQCPLGQWIHGPGGKQWAHKPRFVELTERHAEFHREAGGVAKRINSGAYGEAERLIGSGSRFALVSTEVATLLTRAKRGL